MAAKHDDELRTMRESFERELRMTQDARENVARQQEHVRFDLQTRLDQTENDLIRCNDQLREAREAALNAADVANELRSELDRCYMQIRDLNARIRAYEANSSSRDEDESSLVCALRREIDELKTVAAKEEKEATSKTNEEDERVGRLNVQLQSANRAIRPLRRQVNKKDDDDVVVAAVTSSSSERSSKSAEETVSDEATQRATLWMGRFRPGASVYSIAGGALSTVGAYRSSSSTTGSGVTDRSGFIGTPLWRRVKWWPTPKRTIETYEHSLGIESP